MKKINVLVNGAFGRMGQMAVNAISAHPHLRLVGQTGREYPLKQSILDSHAMVVVDFTHPDSVYQNTRTILDAGAYPVIGTSGLTSEQIKELAEVCDQLQRGCIIAPNFSLGAVLMMKYAQAIAKYMPNVEIIEMHHNGKLDSPSATAIRTAELLAESISEQEIVDKNNQLKTYETVPGARGAEYHGIAIHSVRLPGLLAHQQLVFGHLGEVLTIRHDSMDRSCFMPGMCLACEKVIELKGLIYGLEGIV